MIWWIFRSKMLEAEKASLADLEGNVSWLKVDKWDYNNDYAMYVDFRIVHGGDEFAFQMIYPSVYPDAPPMIFTADRSRISLHQYGADGELCLEFRPDNWHPSITGTDMVKSCQRLLTEERTEGGEILHARSAHIPSLGRDLRSKNLRLLINEPEIKVLNALAECTPEPLALCKQRIESTFISSIHYIGLKENPVWESGLVVPNSNSNNYLNSTGFVVRIPGIKTQGIMKPDILKTLLDRTELQELNNSLWECDTYIYLLIGDEKNWKLYLIFDEPKKRQIITYTTVQIPNERQRLPVDYAKISKKRVGIVGCGSLGSKIAASLCRSGVRNFLLIDEDILFPDNIVRNELDLRSFGVHKTFAMRDRLLNIAPTTKVNTLEMNLGGQESAMLMTLALEALGNCDLLVDATANAIAFNMIASVSKRNMKPMVWGEVFSGGIGGLVARSRPNLDPVPLSARQQIITWCNDRNVDWVGDHGNYEGQDEDGQPLIADDAEVSLIASHVTRFALDILVDPNGRNYPNSVYIVGFREAWLFEQPFETLPIDLQSDGVWGEDCDNLNLEDIRRILEKHSPQN